MDESTQKADIFSNVIKSNKEINQFLKVNFKIHKFQTKNLDQLGFYILEVCISI